jgi:hypothetical protein
VKRKLTRFPSFGLSTQTSHCFSHCLVPLLIFCCACRIGCLGKMEGRQQALKFVNVGTGDMGNVVEDCERVFVVGELVEFWAGPVVRGYRTDSGAPACVKEIYGLGWY